MPAIRRADIVKACKQVWDAKDIDALIGRLGHDATAEGEGGGLAPAAPHPVEGTAHVARSLVERARAVRDVKLLECTVNGRPGLVAQLDGVAVSALAFDIVGDRITRIRAVVSPDKLRPWTAA